jgi:hypothetical protein
MARLGKARVERQQTRERDERDELPKVASSGRIQQPGRAASIGVAMSVLGAWGAGVAYFGPAIGLGPAGWVAWRWSAAHTFLNLLPGAAAMAAGVLVAAGLISARKSLTRTGGALGAAAGAWFVLGAAAYPVLMGSAAPAYTAPGRGALANLAALAGYGRGVGIAVGILAGLALAAADVRPLRPTEPAPVVPLAVPEGAAPVPSPPGWRPQFRSTISRMVPRPAGAARSDGALAAAAPPVGVLAGAAGPTSTGSGGAGGGRWRPRFMAGAPAGPATGGGATRPAAAPAVPRSALRPGEWLLATFPGARLKADDRPVAAEGTAAVTNRRIVFADVSSRDVRDWGLDAVPAEPEAPRVVELDDHVVIDLTDSATSRDFAAAVQAAASAQRRD